MIGPNQHRSPVGIENDIVDQQFANRIEINGSPSCFAVGPGMTQITIEDDISAGIEIEDGLTGSEILLQVLNHHAGIHGDIPDR